MRGEEQGNSISPILSLTVSTFLDASGGGAKKVYRHNGLVNNLLQEAQQAKQACVYYLGHPSLGHHSLTLDTTAFSTTN